MPTMRMFYNFLVFTLCLNFSAWLLPMFIALPVHSPLTYNPTDISTMFSLDVFSRNFTYAVAGAGAITLVALLLRSGTYALYALIVFAVGALFQPISDFILAVPKLVDAVMPREMNPIYPLPNPISLVLTAIFTFAGFMFLMELVTQRQIT